MSNGIEKVEGISSFLDTDLYKLTMQNVILKYFPDVEVTYSLTNRTPDMKLSREAYNWYIKQIGSLGNITVSSAEIDFLRTKCPYLSPEYLDYMSTFRLDPSSHITTTFDASSDTSSPSDLGTLTLTVKGPWVSTILYEIPLLALLSEAYFAHIDTDWTYAGQRAKGLAKGLRLLEAGCHVSEFGTRRRRDYSTHDLVMQGLCDARDEAARRGWSGSLAGTSNVHFAMKYGLAPVGTVAHEYFMGIAALTGRYEEATELALRTWVEAYGRGVLGIALTDTFGTEAFLKAFRKPIKDGKDGDGATFAQTFTGVRQDSGDPLEFLKVMQKFYEDVGIREKKTIVFSDALDVEKCIAYREATVEAGFQPSFGVGTFFTNDFTRASSGEKSPPMNIVIKLSSANGNPAIKISDNAGKNTGDAATVADVKRRLGYTEREWAEGDERSRWGADGADEASK